MVLPALRAAPAERRRDRWFSVSREEQAARFQARGQDPVKQWKLSPTDLASAVDGDQVQRQEAARLEAMRVLLSQFDYPSKDHLVVGQPDPLLVGSPDADDETEESPARHFGEPGEALALRAFFALLLLHVRFFGIVPLDSTQTKTYKDTYRQ